MRSAYFVGWAACARSRPPDARRFPVRRAWQGKITGKSCASNPGAERSLRRGETAGRLDRAALDLATIQFPDLQPEPYLDQLNELASRLGDRLRNFNDGRDFVETAQRYLFGELGFHG